MNKYCTCKNPELEVDDNNFAHCLICDKESKLNDFEPDDTDEERNIEEKKDFQREGDGE